MNEPAPRRSRFAPSPTGMMHIGNLRTALYTYLLAKMAKGVFILRIEDTDQERLVPGATELIYRTLKACGLQHDEGPDLGGPVGPYVQSERLGRYKAYAERLLETGKAYRCFCEKSKEETEAEATPGFGYGRHCRHLSPEALQAKLDAKQPYVIRQAMPLSGQTHFDDLVYGRITVAHEELEDQILLKSDGFPTYNFANVVDDHEMGITHVARGSEYLSSTPKYQLLYQAFGWEPPCYVHLPLINGTDGKKLSKRHGATNFDELVDEGYLPEAIMNYIAFLGWSPGRDTRELFTLAELTDVFDPKHISKAPAVFDPQKLTWYNAQYIKAMAPEAFAAWIADDLKALLGEKLHDAPRLIQALQSRLEKKTALPAMIDFIQAADPYEEALFFHKRQKLTPALSLEILKALKASLSALPSWEHEPLQSALMSVAESGPYKTGQVMGPVRSALSGRSVTPGGATDLLCILGRKESLQRFAAAIDYLSPYEGESA